MTAIIDYDAGNLKSVEKAVTFLGFDAKVTSDPKEIMSASKVILPGVGAFGSAMGRIRACGIDDAIYAVAERGVPLLGICLGFQLLFESSEESPGVSGLSILSGKIVAIPKTCGIKVPHMGWNSLELTENGRDSKLFCGIGVKPYVYFVHSYYLKSDEERIVLARTTHGSTLDVTVSSGSVMATQFHPEKSSDTGLKILKNFLM